MIIATLKGRLQTKIATYVLLGLLATLFSMMWTPTIWIVFGIAAGVGLALEIVWGTLIEYQPGWLTFILGALEYGVLASILILAAIPITFIQATTFYWISWVIIQLFLIYLLPILRTDWADNGHELL